MTDKGEELLLKTMETYDPAKFGVYTSALPIKDLFGKFPEFPEIMSMLRNIYGEDFMTIFNKLEEKIEESLEEKTPSNVIPMTPELASVHS